MATDLRLIIVAMISIICVQGCLSEDADNGAPYVVSQKGAAVFTIQSGNFEHLVSIAGPTNFNIGNATMTIGGREYTLTNGRCEQTEVGMGDCTARFKTDSGIAQVEASFSVRNIQTMASELETLKIFLVASPKQILISR